MEKRTRRSYTPEFKEQAIALASDLKSIVKAEQELGIPRGLLRTWKRNASKMGLSVPPSAEGKLTAEEEVRRLRKENEQLKKVNHILKSAAAFFSQDHLK